MALSPKHTLKGFWYYPALFAMSTFIGTMISLLVLLVRELLGATWKPAIIFATVITVIVVLAFIWRPKIVYQTDDDPYISPD